MSEKLMDLLEDADLSTRSGRSLVLTHEDWHRISRALRKAVAWLEATDERATKPSLINVVESRRDRAREAFRKAIESQD